MYLNHIKLRRINLVHILVDLIPYFLEYFVQTATQYLSIKYFKHMICSTHAFYYQSIWSLVSFRIKNHSYSNWYHSECVLFCKSIHKEERYNFAGQTNCPSIVVCVKLHYILEEYQDCFYLRLNLVLKYVQ